MTSPPSFPEDPFTGPMARELGITRRHLDAGVRQQDVLRLLHGVYLRKDVVITPVLLAQATALVVEESSVICDRTASWILGVDCFDYAELDRLLPVECYVLRGRDPTDRAQCAGGTRDLLPEDWFDLGGVRVTTPLRTAMDLGCKLSRRSALAAMDALMRAYEFTHTEMRRLLQRYFRRRGVVQLRELVALVDPRAESSGESWTRLEIHDRGLPAPEPQHWFLVDGVPTYRLDLAYIHARVAVEYDGEEFHSSDERRVADEKRRTWLRKHGWIVIVVDKKSFTEEAVMEWIGELRGALGLRLT